MSAEDTPTVPAGDDDLGLIGPTDIAFHLDLTAAQLKVTYTALRTMFDDLGHEESDVREIVRAVLDKLPEPESIRAIDISTELRRIRGH
jgi:hypothetical protein